MKDLYKDISKVYKQTETKKILLIPALKRALKTNSRKTKLELIDIGCGTGDFFKLARGLGYHYHGIDISRSMLAVAKTKHHLADFRELSGTNFKDEYKTRFDAVLINLVLQDLNLKVIKDILMETKKCLNKNGRVVVGIHHPILDHYMRFGLFGKSNIKTKFKGYFSSGQKYIISYKYDNRKPVDFICYHRTLQDFLKIFIDVGFRITSIDECRPMKISKNVSLRKILEKSNYPTYMVITLQN